MDPPPLYFSLSEREIIFHDPRPLLISPIPSKMSMKRLTNLDFTQDKRDPQRFTSNERIHIPAGSKWMIVKNPYVDAFNSLGKKVSSYMYISCRDIIPQVITIDNVYSPGTWESELIVECKDDREEFVTVRITHISESGVTAPISWEFSYSFVSSLKPHPVTYHSPSSAKPSICPSSKKIMKKLTNKDFSRCGEHALLSNSMIRVPKGSKYVTIQDLNMKAINFGRPDLGPNSIHIAMSIGEDGIGMFTFPVQSSGLPRETSATIPVKESMEIKDGRMELVITAYPGDNAEIVGDWEFFYGFMGFLDIPEEEKARDETLSSEVAQSSSRGEEKRTQTWTSLISRRTSSSSAFLLGLVGALTSAAKRSSTGLVISGSIMYVSSVIFLHDASMRSREERVRRVACRCDE